MKKLELLLVGAGTVGAILIGRAYFRAQDEKERQKIRALGAAAAEAERQRLLAEAAKQAATLPKPGPTPPPPPAFRQVPIGTTLTALPGHRYLVTIETNGSVNAAASESAVANYARDEHFTDVIVSKTKPAGWPSPASGDYYLTGTFSGPAPKTFDRKTGVFLGSVVVLDAWEVTGGAHA